MPASFYLYLLNGELNLINSIRVILVARLFWHFEI